MESLWNTNRYSLFITCPCLEPAAVTIPAPDLWQCPSWEPGHPEYPLQHQTPHLPRGCPGQPYFYLLLTSHPLVTFLPPTLCLLLPQITFTATFDVSPKAMLGDRLLLMGNVSRWVGQAWGSAPSHPASSSGALANWAPPLSPVRITPLGPARPPSSWSSRWSMLSTL